LSIRAQAQGFVNLDFEGASLAAYGDGPAIVPTPDALPGWVAYVNGIAQDEIFYNTVPLSLAEVTIQGPASEFTPISGHYTVWLWGEYRPSGGPGASASIGQTSEVPLSSQTLTLWGAIQGIQVTFNGQGLGFQVTGSVGDYSIYTADISALAGQTGELRFTAPVNQVGVIDNIQFSNIPIPEPGVLSLFALGLLGLGWHGRRRG